jgi:hypothetical protein
MRVTSVTLYADPGEEVITFSLSQADPRAQYIVRNMVGLDAEELIPKFYGSGLYTKPKFFDFGLKAREIVTRIVLNPRIRIDESYSDIRDELYRAISATRTGLVTMHFNSGATTVSKISGFITKFEVPYFTQLPEVQITIRCDDPMFRAINPVIFDPPDLSVTNPIIIADSLSTAPHGFSMRITFKAAAPSFTIQDVPTNPEWKFKVIPSGGFLNGDVLHFSSDYANKYLYMIRGGITTYLIDRVEPQSIWPVIFPGANTFHFVDIASFNWSMLEYYAAYWGV